MTVKRFNPVHKPMFEMEENPNGNYILYTDYAKLEERVLAAYALMKEHGLNWDEDKLQKAYLKIEQTLMDEDEKPCEPGCSCIACRGDN